MLGYAGLWNFIDLCVFDPLPLRRIPFQSLDHYYMCGDGSKKMFEGSKIFKLGFALFT